MTAVAGIDVGSKGTKAVIIDGGRRVLGSALVRTRPEFARVGR